jgi:hypothetical protein
LLATWDLFGLRLEAVDLSEAVVGEGDDLGT